MRLSRPRVLLRAALLVLASGFVIWKAWEAHLAANAAAGTPSAVLLSRVALVEALLGALGLVAAGVALSALRTRKRAHTLRLGDLPGARSAGDGHGEDGGGDGGRPGASGTGAPQ